MTVRGVVHAALVAGIFCSCSGRKPASEDTDTRVVWPPVVDQPLAGSQEELLSQLSRVYYLSAANLEQFDADLDRAVAAGDDNTDALLQSVAYSRLMAGWDMSEKIRDKITENYRSILQIASGEDNSGTSSERAVAARWLNQFHQSIVALEGIETLPYVDLVDDLRAEQMSLAARSKRLWTHLDISRDDFEFDSFKDKSDRAIRALDSEMRGILKENAQKALKVTDSLSKQFIRNAADIRQILMMKPKREPQSLKIFPSSSSAGNLIGNVFPLGMWTLTYDDGPSSNYTPQVLDMLDQQGVKATFFWLGKNMKALPKIVERAKKAGMPLENHSWSHVNLAKASEAVLQREINQSHAVETQAYGKAPEYFRTPYGSGFNLAKVRGRLVALKQVHVFWNVDSLDWQDKSASSVLARVQKQMRINKRGVILFHDIHPQSVAASRMLLNWVKAENAKAGTTKMRFVTVPEAVNEVNGVEPTPGS
jgi:peptidoglycan/xylan/chitin deacetylase (PgdA/CDA1 family)